MRKCTLLILLFSILIFSKIAHTQNYLPGYVINNQNDTLKGFIDYHNWGVNPHKINFKNSPDAEIQVFSPLSISAFVVSDEKYYSAIVEIETSPLQSNLDKESAFKLLTDTVFLQTLIEGSKSLYLYKSPVGKSNFYIYQGGKFELLLHKKYIKDYGQEVGVRENKRYVGQLAVYLSECGKTKTQAEHTKYSFRSLVNLFTTFYKCTHDQISFQKKEEKPAYEFGLLVGGSHSSLNINGQGEYNVPELSSSLNLAYGVSFDVLLPRNNRQWSIVNELIFPTYLAKGEYLNYNLDTVKLEIGAGYIKMVNMLRFSYPVNDFMFFVNLGIGNGRLISQRNHMTKISKYTYFNKPVESNFMIMRNHEQSIIGGAGARWNRWSIEYRAEAGNGMSRYMFVSTKTVRQYLLVSYKLMANSSGHRSNIIAKSKSDK